MLKKFIFLLVTIVFLSCINETKKLPENFDFGSIENYKYINNYFNLQIRFDSIWIVQTQQQMNSIVKAGNELLNDNDNLKDAVKASQVNSAYLFTIFKFEHGTVTKYNPSFMVIAENTKMYPDIERGRDYLFEAQKFLNQTKIDYTFDMDIEEKNISNKNFDVMYAETNLMGMKIYQDYFSTVNKGFSLSFIISYSNEEEKKELYKIIKNINFGSMKKPRKIS